MTGDKREHHLLDRPRNAPTRTAIGIAGITCTSCSSSPRATTSWRSSCTCRSTTSPRPCGCCSSWLRRSAFWITKRICLSLQRADRQKVLHGRETGTIWRYADGRFEEIHAPLTPNERWVLVQHESHEPLQLTAGKDANGVDSPIARKERLRAKFSNFYFRDRVAPPTPSELEAAHHEHDDHGAAATVGTRPSSRLGPPANARRSRRTSTDTERRARFGSTADERDLPGNREVPLGVSGVSLQRGST